MSKTPETDAKAAENKANFPHGFTTIYSGCHVDAAFARTLETQRDEARAEVERLRKRGQEIHRRAQKAERRACRVNRLFLKWKSNAEFWHREFFRHHGIGLTIATPNHRNTPHAITETVIPVSSTQPEIFEAHGVEGYRHDGSEECPCNGLDKVDLLYKPPGMTVEKSIGVKEVIWENKGFSESLHIIGWRPADAPEKLPH